MIRIGLRNLTLGALAFCALSPANADAQTRRIDRGPHRLEVTVERYEEKQWVERPSKYVFDQGDKLRFRVKANFGGYLYVTNLGTSGRYATLYPHKDTPRLQNLVEPGVPLHVPATTEAFVIGGPAGHDIVYWTVTPRRIGEIAPEYQPLPPPPAPKERPKSLVPRCDDVILRARGDCIDNSAGPKAVTDAQQLPAYLNPDNDLRPRQVQLIQRDDSTVVTSRRSVEGPVVFEFLLAHR